MHVSSRVHISSYKFISDEIYSMTFYPKQCYILCPCTKGPFVFTFGENGKWIRYVRFRLCLQNEKRMYLSYTDTFTSCMQIWNMDYIHSRKWDVYNVVTDSSLIHLIMVMQKACNIYDTHMQLVLGLYNMYNCVSTANYIYIFMFLFCLLQYWTCVDAH
jgi:hypothetical protein